MRRIAMLSIHSSPLARLGGKEAGGMNVYVRELARELGRAGLAVDIFTRMQDRTVPTTIPLGGGARLISLQTGPAAPYNKNEILTYLPEFVSRARCFAEGEDLTYDLIHSHYWISGQAALALRRSWGVPVVQMFHTLGAMKNNVARSAEETETNQRIAIERTLLREADAIVAATPLDRAQMVWYYGADHERIHIIPCGVDLRHFRPRPRHDARARLGWPDNQKIVLCVGRMEPLKGMDNLIRAVALLHHRSDEWRGALRGMLVGGHSEEVPRSQWNEEQRRLDHLRTEAGIAEAITFVGSQPHNHLRDYYTAADLVVVPSHYESFGMVALEALACGAAVVASDVGGLSYLIEQGHSGMLVAPDVPDDLANQIDTLLRNEQQRQRMAEQARQRAQSYNWSTIADSVRHLYGRLLEPRCRAACSPVQSVYPLS
jgi:D-inositol-3-phosphate glycosyltransferase